MSSFHWFKKLPSSRMKVPHKPRRWVAVIFSILFACSISFSSTNSALADDPIREHLGPFEKLVRDFIDIAMGYELHLRGTKEKRIRKWTRSIRYQIKGDIDEDLRNFIRTRMAYYREATGLNIFELSFLPNFIINFVPREHLKTLSQDSETPSHRQKVFSALYRREMIPCFFFLTAGAKRIRSADIYVATGYEKNLTLQCLEEEIAQSFGLPNDSNTAKDTIFNDDGLEERSTCKDHVFLKLLYSSNIRHGDGVETVKAAALSTLRSEFNVLIAGFPECEEIRHSNLPNRQN